MVIAAVHLCDNQAQRFCMFRSKPISSPPRIPSVKPRSVRVFVSSTFIDMHSEREELVKRVFPRLRYYYRSSGLSLSEIDFRWGVTEDQAGRGKTLSICLEEIDRCHPFFIGMIGDRYGSAAPSFTPADLKAYPWLAEFEGRSLTEIEIAYAVLNRPTPPACAALYFRARRPEIQTSNSTVSGESEQVDKLTELIRRIRNTQVLVREDYPDASVFGEWAYQDLKRFIDERFPEALSTEQHDQELQHKAAFVAARVGMYFGGERYRRQLNRHVNGPSVVSRLAGVFKSILRRDRRNSDRRRGTLTIVTGAPGSGKSAFLANWALDRARCSNEVVVTHFVGASPQSRDWEDMIDRLLVDLCARFTIQYLRPSTPAEIRYAFAACLIAISGRGTATIVIDGLDRLEDRDGAQELSWLPAKLPDRVNVIASALPGKALDALFLRGGPVVELGPLDHSVRQRLITSYLRTFSKTLESTLISTLSRAPLAGNPLFLRSVLGELRVLGDREKLSQVIDVYLSVGDIHDLFAEILNRCERDFDTDHPGLVGQAMALLSSAKSGLSEPELLDLLGSDRSPLPSAYWSPLLESVEQFLTVDTGLIRFSHDAFWQAVESRYLGAEAARLHVHDKMADYFAAPDQRERAPHELPWHLIQIAQWERLRDRLVEPNFASEVAQINEFDFKRYWVQIEEQSTSHLAGAYVAPDPKTGVDGRAVRMWNRLATLIYEMGRFQDALTIVTPLVNWCRSAQDAVLLNECLSTLGKALKSLELHDRAWEVFRESEAISRKLEDTLGLRRVLGPIGVIFTERGQYEEARITLEEGEALCRKYGDLNGLQVALADQALLFSVLGDLDKEGALHEEEEQICRQIGNLDGLARSLMNQSRLFLKRGALEHAKDVATEASRLHREIGDQAYLIVDLYNLGCINLKLNEWQIADTQFGEGLDLCEKHGLVRNKPQLLKGRITSLWMIGSYRFASHLARDLNDLQRTRGSIEGQLEALGFLYRLEERQGNFDAMATLETQIRSLSDV